MIGRCRPRVRSLCCRDRFFCGVPARAARPRPASLPIQRPSTPKSHPLNLTFPFMPTLSLSLFHKSECSECEGPYPIGPASPSPLLSSSSPSALKHLPHTSNITPPPVPSLTISVSTAQCMLRPTEFSAHSCFSTCGRDISSLNASLQQKVPCRVLGLPAALGRENGRASRGQISIGAGSWAPIMAHLAQLGVGGQSDMKVVLCSI